MSELKTPYLDKEINNLKWEDYGGVISADDEEKLKEYQQIKDTLLDYELNKEGLARVCAELQKAQAERDKLREEKNEFIRALKDCIDVLEQVRAERDELKAALKPFQDYPDDFSKEAPKDKFTMTVFCSDIAKAQELLKAKK